MKKILTFLMAAMMTLTVAVTATATTDSKIQLQPDAATGMNLVGGLLKPGEEYRFPIQVVLEDGKAQALTDEILKEYTFKIGNTGSGGSIASMKLTKIGGVHYIVATVKAGWPTKQSEEQYSFKLMEKADSKNVREGVVEFKTGYAIVDDAVIDALTAEQEVEVDKKAPLFTKEQLERIARLNNYKAVTFTGDSWTYSANITDMPDTNLVYNTNAVKEILTQYENQSFEFLTFPAGPRFTTGGALKMDVANLSEDFGETFFVYRYLDGKLTLVSSQFDAQEDTLTINTNTLGRFVITDRAIKNAIVTPPSNDGSGSGSGSNGSSDGSNSGANPNPGTGASAASVMIALGSIAALAGAMGITKRK